MLNLLSNYYDIGTGTISVYDYDSVFSDMIKEITSNRRLMYELKKQAETSQ